MQFGLSDKVALVLGSGGGLGRQIAQSLAAEGAKIIASDANAEACKQTAAEISRTGGICHGVVADLADREAIRAGLCEAFGTLGQIDILVNNSGGPPPSTAAGLPEQQWRDSFESMVLSLIAITDIVLPGMRQRKWGRIITSSSSGVVAPIPNLGLSNALRSTLVGWSKTLAREVAKDGITVNVVVPGRIATQRIVALDEARAKREGKSIGAVVNESVSSIPLGRYGRPDEYASVVTFLASECASYVTGAIIRVDGGLLANI